MKQTITKSFIGTPFKIEVATVDNKPGTWSSEKVSVYRCDNLIGEYIRNYHRFAALTFYPFRIGQDWYALYSAHYTATRVMKLQENKIEDWCGEEVLQHGFCPVEIYVPQYNKYAVNDESKIEYYTVDVDYITQGEFCEDQTTDMFVSSEYCNFGFLCGCVWGDDSNWKLRYIDLSQIPNKILTITDKFGYFPLPVSLTLRQCIDMNNWEPDDQLLALTKEEYIRL